MAARERARLPRGGKRCTVAAMRSVARRSLREGKGGGPEAGPEWRRYVEPSNVQVGLESR